mmetsp:Transcript_26329/g.36709  ORF Transcript_26329/g.36709 Transcript_26329/m.36709 type:complete len:252 (+) Transcript_26329:783-1538(+)
MCILRFAEADIKSIAISLSLSKTALPIISLHSVMKRRVEVRNCCVVSYNESTSWSWCNPSSFEVCDFPERKMSSRSKGVGRFLFPQSFSSFKTFFTSLQKSFRNARFSNGSFTRYPEVSLFISSLCSLSKISATERSQSMLSGSLGPKRTANICFAHTTQWTGLSGVDRIVQTAYVFCCGGGVHSKQAVVPGIIGVTCPRYPWVPLSMRGFFVVKHILFTCCRALRLSNAFMTMSNLSKYEASNFGSFIFP